MGFTANLIINQSFYNKLNGDNIKKAEVETIKLIASEAEENCRMECPVRTGNLRDSHYTVFEEDTAKVMNTAEYASAVIYGTESRSPNDYPQRALNNLNGTYEELFINALMQYGVLGS